MRIHLFGVQAQNASHAPRPAILLFFGGGWRVGSIHALEDQARAFAARGYVAALADYRVRCRDGSTVLGSLQDARTAYSWLRDHNAEFGIDAGRIVLAGGSAGGYLALASALFAGKGRQPAALVLFNPAVDLVTPAPFYLKPIAWFISPSTRALDALPPTIVFHGEADRRVPISTIRTFCGRAVQAGRTCELVGYPGRQHGFYHDHAAVAPGAVVPYDDTLNRAFAFLDRQGINNMAPAGR